MDETEFIAIDLETTGKYPLGTEICELAMIRFNRGGILNRFETLVRPKKGMASEAERIHGLSLDSLQSAPFIEDVLPRFIDFVSGASLLGHNLPFDLGFLAHDFDQVLGPKWWENSFKAPNFCTSLISLQTHPKLKTHRLIYLCEHFQVKTSPNHRAMQDAQSCMEVFLKLTENIKTVEELVKVQKDALLFTEFSVVRLEEKNPIFEGMAKACRKGVDFDLMYSKGSRKNRWRKLSPKGLVMKTKGESFVVGTDEGETQTKRFMLDKILETKLA